MNATTRALIDKEADEARWALYAGASLLIALPLLTMAVLSWRWAGTYILLPVLSAASAALGGVFVVVVAITIAARDFRDGERAAWRILPVRPLPFVATKFLAGLVASVGIVMLAQLVHIGICLLIGGNSHLFGERLGQEDGVRQLTSHVFLLAALYAIAFAIAAASRHVMTALFLSTIAGALLYFLPLLTPALENVSYFALLGKPPIWLICLPAEVRDFPGSSIWHIPGMRWWIVYPKAILTFVPAMLALFTGAVAAAWLVVRHNFALTMSAWRIAWVLIGVALGLFGLAATQVGSNIEPVKITHLIPPNQTIASNVILSGKLGAALTISTEPSQVTPTLYLQPLDLSVPSPIAPRGLWVNRNYDRGRQRDARKDWVWSPQQPTILYLLGASLVSGGREALLTIDLSAQANSQIVHHEAFASNDPETFTWPLSLHMMNGQLYVWLATSRGRIWQIWRYSLANPKLPTKDREWTLPSTWNTFNDGSDHIDTYFIPIPPMEGLTWQERFELRAHLLSTYGPRIVTPQHAVTYDDNYGLRVFVATTQTDTSVTYELRGSRPLTALERLTSHAANESLITDENVYDDRFYLLSAEQLTVFDIRDPAQPRKVGHYIVPDEQFRSLARLDDGRVAVFGRSMHVLDLRGR